MVGRSGDVLGYGVRGNSFRSDGKEMKNGEGRDPKSGT